MVSAATGETDADHIAVRLRITGVIESITLQSSRVSIIPLCFWAGLRFLTSLP